MTENNALETLDADINDIYLGNLGTVEADLALPAAGKRGSVFTWTSKERLFLSDEGKVTRPTFGVGNRDIVLHLVASFDGQEREHDYKVTVLQEEPQTVIVSVDTVEVTAFAGADPVLPSVAVVHLNDGSAEVRPVTWQKLDGQALSKAQEHDDGDSVVYAEGVIKGWDRPVMANVNVVFVHPAALDRNGAEASRSAFVRTQGRISDGNGLADKVHARLEFLLGVDDDQMLYNFRVAAGLSTNGAQPMTGWDNPEGNLRGHTTGHYLSALALAYSATGERRLLEKIDTMVTVLAQCQKAEHDEKGYSWGFLSGYSEEQFDKLEEYVTYPTIWAPYYTFDKIVSGLLDCYEYAGSEQALQIALKMGFWVNNRLGRLTKAQRDKMWSIYIAGEYGGIISALIRLHRITGNAKFIETAGYFHNDKLLYPMSRNVDTLGGMHANQHIPQIIGALDTATEGCYLEGLELARNFWNMLVAHHLYAIGGTGETEMFRAPDAIAAYLTDKPAESCATYNLSKLSMKLFETDPNSSYVDYYENALFNDLMPATHSEPDGGTVYFFPLRPGGKLAFDTDENTCCHGTGLENMFRFEENIVKSTSDKAYVNLYIPSTIQASGGKLALDIAQTGEGSYTITVSRNEDVELLLRRPQWTASMSVKINGVDAATHDAVEPGYIAFDDKVREGDCIEVTLGMRLRVIAAPDDATISALAYGPYVLAALSDKQEFIELPEAEVLRIADADSELDNVLAQLANLAGVSFKKLNEVDDERYHVYLRIGK